MSGEKSTSRFRGTVRRAQDYLGLLPDDEEVRLSHQDSEDTPSEAIRTENVEEALNDMEEERFETEAGNSFLTGRDNDVSKVLAHLHVNDVEQTSAEVAETSGVPSAGPMLSDLHNVGLVEREDSEIPFVYTGLTEEGENLFQG